MSNKSSPHGGFISEGTISHGTLRTQDLLRAFASELERVLPFNGAKLVGEARESADKIDTICGATDEDFTAADDVLTALMDQLNEIAHREGLYFGNTEGDGSDFGYWAIEADADEEPEKLWFSSSSGKIELQMTLERAQSASHQGQCDDDVLALSRVPEIASQLAAIDPDTLRDELREYGWDDDELKDHDQNLQRLLWLAAGDIVEENRS